MLAFGLQQFCLKGIILFYAGLYEAPMSCHCLTCSTVDYCQIALCMEKQCGAPQSWRLALETWTQVHLSHSHSDLRLDSDLRFGTREQSFFFFRLSSNKI